MNRDKREGDAVGENRYRRSKQRALQTVGTEGRDEDQN